MTWRMPGSGCSSWRVCPAELLGAVVLHSVSVVFNLQSDAQAEPNLEHCNLRAFGRYLLNVT